MVAQGRRADNEYGTNGGHECGTDGQMARTNGGTTVQKLNDGMGVGLLLKTLFGYNGNPALTESIAYVVYFGFVWWVVRRTQRPTPVPAAA